MIDIELPVPHHVTVGYVGEPGDRTFFLQAQDDEQLVSLRMEKGQVAGIGDLLAQLLVQVESSPATDWDRRAMQLRSPVEERWAVGNISLGVDPDSGRFLIEVAELRLVDDPELDDEGRQARIWCDLDQARRLAAHADEIVEQGRPRCQFCGRPMAADGSHVCPSTNGHGKLSR